MTEVATRTVEDLATAQELMETMLVGAGYSGFCFDAVFYMRFVRPTRPSFRGRLVPQALELQLLGPWRLGDAATWEQRVQRLADPNAAQPEEAVQAYELASLRWQEGTVVEAVLLGPTETVIRLTGGTKLVIAELEGEESWLLCPAKKVLDRTFTVACEDSRYYACIPAAGSPGE